MAGGSLLHKFGKEPRLIGCAPLARNIAEDPVAHGPPLPVGNDRFLIAADIFFGDAVAGHGPVV
ncbi:MAG: hypothetical protein ACD_75C00615G0002 [uncultured bacterium]|nr:MAG: hypothetical protein ACD_75C00615G0002 [uncultured bacterium]